MSEQTSQDAVGGAVAEWSKALLKREKINENQKIPGSPPGLGTFKKIIKKIINELMSGTATSYICITSTLTKALILVRSPLAKAKKPLPKQVV